MINNPNMLEETLENFNKIPAEVIKESIKEVTMNILNKIRQFKCNILDCHKPNDEVRIEHHIIKSKCKYCGRKITIDSQGNWFSY